MFFQNEVQDLQKKLEDHSFQTRLEFVSQYHIKVFLEKNRYKLGFLNVWYSPKKNKISLTYTNIADSSYIPELEQITNFKNFKGKSTTSRNGNLKGIHIFVDGAFRNDKIYYGFIALKDGTIIEQQKDFFLATKEITQRNVAGEIKAVELAVSWAVSQSYKEIFIHYDYLGLEKWAKNEWKANIPLTRQYKEFFKNKRIQIHWIKVKSHSGNKYNEMIDQYIVS